MLMKGCSEFEGILLRLGEAFCIGGDLTQVKLAEALGIRQSSISDAKKRSTRDKRYPVPAEWLVKALSFAGVDPDWIITGLGPKYRVLSDDPHGALTVKELTKRIVEKNKKEPTFEELLNGLTKKLPEGATFQINYAVQKEVRGDEHA